MKKFYLNASYFDEENTVFYEIQDKENDYNSIGMYSFTNIEGKTVPISNNFSENCIACINILIEDEDDVSAVVLSTIFTFDPSLDYNETFEVAESILSPGGSKGTTEGIDALEGFTHNSINYLLYKENGYPGYYYYLIVTIE